ncbi:MAG TPA: hypothetical protein VGC21_02765, partial [Telluria sp.]
MLRALAGVLTLALLMPAIAAPPLAARIDGAPLYDFTVDTMWHMSQAGAPKVQRKEVLDALISNRLLAAAARRR